MNGEQSAYPLLVLPSPRRADRSRRRGGGGGVRYPEVSRQVQRLAPRFQVLQESFETRRAELQTDLAGAEPEQVLVLETVGTVEDFIRAVRRVEGLEFLGEFDEDDIPPDEDFYLEENRDRPLGGTVYLLMTNQQAMQQLLTLWQRFRDHPDAAFDRGLGRFRDVFRFLRDVRPWGPEDRLRDSGVLTDWRDRIQLGQQILPTEIELWYRDDDATRQAADAEIRRYVGQVQGEVVTSAVIQEIRYHAVLARLPIDVVERVLNEVAPVELVRSERVMFLRPTGQAVLTPGAEEGLATPLPEAPEGDLEPPVIALLDGVPLEQHEALARRLTVDDPDGYSADAPAQRRRHGTAMASLILHGDLTDPGAGLTSRLYVRPILKPGPDWVSNAPEQIPDDVLVVDLVHRACRRLFEGEGEQGPTAPTVRVINLSIGNPSAPFVRMLSPWARLLDWLAWRYQLLIVTSAGNHGGEITLPMAPNDVRSLTAQELEKVTLQGLAADGRMRRLLPPAEALNALTVGASHHDESAPSATDGRRELINCSRLPAPFSALGLGFRRSIKPDVLMPGGRRLYELASTTDPTTTVLRAIDQPTSPPGQLVASPAGHPGSLRGRVYWAGTSNAAALTSRTAAQLHQRLVELRQQGNAGFLADQGILVAAIKALLVHGAELGESMAILWSAFNGQVDPRRLREFISRFVGYGSIDIDRTFGSTAQRATMIGGGHLAAEQADIFQVPLPPSLSGRAGRRRLTLTLAWLTPANTRDHRYRRARLWFEPPPGNLRLSRLEADWHAAQRGTVQHEILEGRHASVFTADDFLTIQVNCAAYAGELTGPVPYALAASLEVAPELNVAVFTEIRNRIRIPVAVRSST